MQSASTPDLDRQQELFLQTACLSEPTTTTTTTTLGRTGLHPAKRSRSDRDITESPRKVRRVSTSTFRSEAPADAEPGHCVRDESVLPPFSSQPSTDLVAEDRKLSPTLKKRRLLPSPSTSGSARYESICPESSAFCANVPPQPNPGVGNKIAGQNSTWHSAGRKRRRPDSATDLRTRDRSRRGSSSAVEILETSSLPESPVHEQEDSNPEGPIRYWARTGEWPESFPSMSKERSSSPKKRPASSSYTQQVKEGEVPPAYSPAYETYLAQHGIYMEEERGRANVRDESKAMCRLLLEKVYPDPSHTPYPLSKFLSVWQRVQNRNEARIVRDLTSVLVPSPELLCIDGHDELEHVAEEVDAEWTKTSTLAGPTPKPDRAFGVAAHAFDEEETAKLKNYTAYNRPTLFTEHMYFPFLLCEVKCADQGIKRADRQNMHSASMALNGLVQFLSSADPAVELNGEVLAISISHDNERSKLYGHFPVIEGTRCTFYRYPIASFVLNFDEHQGWKRTHDFVRATCEVFYPPHLARIRAALAKMEDPRSLVKISTMSIGEGDDRDLSQSLSQARDASALSSPGTGVFKVPSEPASKRQKGALALLQEQLAEQQKQSREQTALLERQLEEQRKQSKEQMAEQQKQSREQMALLERQMAEQAEQFKEQIKLLKQLAEQR